MSSSSVRKNPTHSLVSLLLSLGLIVGGLWLALNRQEVTDWWRLRNYTPNAAVKQLADNDTMQGRGRELFYISDPQIQDSAAFNASCSKKGEQTIVLGCYKADQVFLYNVTDPQLDGVKEVTAAHEMLHAAYQRLDDDEKQRVNTLLKPIIDSMADPRILELITLYNKEEPGELYNEMHSILGTEYATLTPELEQYYEQYFSDRSKIIHYANQYQALFTDSRNKLEAYDSRLGDIKSQIDQNNMLLRQQQIELETQSSQLSQLRAQGNTQQYNQAVPGYNTRVRDFNSLVEQTRSLVEQYNALVTERNQQAAAQDNLYQGLNSAYQPAVQQ